MTDVALSGGTLKGSERLPRRGTAIHYLHVSLSYIRNTVAQAPRQWPVHSPGHGADADADADADTDTDRYHRGNRVHAYPYGARLNHRSRVRGAVPPTILPDFFLPPRRLLLLTCARAH